MIKLKKIFVLSIGFALLLSCQRNNEDLAIPTGETEVALADISEPNASANLAEQSAEKSVEEKIIKTGNFRYEVQDLDKAYTFLQETTKKNKGFIENDNTNNNYGTQTRQLTIRIPSANFDQFFASLSKEVAYFDYKNISSTNVTAQFIDVQARLTTKKALEARYLELLSKTSKMAEVIELEKSLSAVREDIESTQGQMNYLKDQIAMSTLTVEIYKKSASGYGVTESYVSKIGRAFVSGFNSLSGFFLSIIELWPYATIIALLIVYLRLRKRRKSATRNN